MFVFLQQFFFSIFYLMSVKPENDVMFTLLAGYGILYIVSEDTFFEAEQAHNSLFLQWGLSISSLWRLSCILLFDEFIGLHIRFPSQGWPLRGPLIFKYSKESEMFLKMRWRHWKVRNFAGGNHKSDGCGVKVDGNHWNVHWWKKNWLLL